jgi:tyrosyl-tRNA synthetase
MTVAQALVETGLTASLGEARRAIAQGGVYLNNAKVEDEAATVAGAALAGGRAVLRRGKKTLAGLTFA